MLNEYKEQNLRALLKIYNKVMCSDTEPIRKEKEI